MRLRSRLFRFVFICGANAALSQQPSLVLKSTTRVVQVNAIVRKGGQPVTDLTQSDFRVFDDGKEQKISFFQMESYAILPVSASPLPPHTFTNQLTQQSGAPSAVTVILLDSLNTKFSDQAYAKQQVIKFLQTIQPDDHIGIYTLGSGLRVLHDYTSDSRGLLAQLSKYNPQIPFDGNIATGDSGAGGGELLGLNTWLSSGGLSAEEREFYTTNRVLGTLKALEFIADHLSSVPGRKNLIWVSGGFPSVLGLDNPGGPQNRYTDVRTFSFEIDHAVRALSDANIAMYPVDARGLMVDPQFSAERGGHGNLPQQLRRGAMPPPPVGSRNQDTMIELASRTGGRAYFNTNDFKRAINEAVSDSRVTYTVGFYPASEKFDGKFHKLTLKIDRSGLDVRYRKGYFDMPQSPQDEKAAKGEIHDAVWSPLDATAISLTAQLTPLAQPNRWDVSVTVDPSGISLEPNGDRWQGKLDVLLVQKDERGRSFNGVDNALQFNVLEANYRKLTSKGAVFHQPIEQSPRASVLRVVVRDAASGNIGSVTIPFERLTR